MKPITRRQACALLASLPFAARVHGQLKPTAQHRLSLNKQHGLLLAPNGILHAWHTGVHLTDAATDALGLGHNRPIAPFTLAPVPGVNGVVTMAAGASCSFAVLGDGRLLAWGLNAGNGLLGTTPRSVVEVNASWGPNSNVPVQIVADFHAVDVSSVGNHVLALARDGSVYAWGRGDKGQLGVGPMPVINFKTRTPAAMAFVPFPVRVPELSRVTAISAGTTHSLACLADGTVRAWGENRFGQIGDGTTINRDRPVAVPGIKTAVAVAAGTGGFSVALLADGTVMTWGSAVNGALGRGPRGGATPTPTPALVPGVTAVRAIAAGHEHVMALTESGTVITWGDDSFGAIGRVLSRTSAAAPVPGVSGVQRIAAFEHTSLAVLASGRIMTWGEVRPWTRPPEQGSFDNLSDAPILFWLDGLEQP